MPLNIQKIEKKLLEKARRKTDLIQTCESFTLTASQCQHHFKESTRILIKGNRNEEHPAGN